MRSREATFAALFAAVSNAAGFVTKSRTIKHWSETNAADQPALFQLEGKQTYESRPGIGSVVKFHAEIYVYAHASNTTAGADLVSLLNTLLDAVLVALAPVASSAGTVQSLGGLVTDVRVEGEIDVSEGRLGPQAVAIIPLVIVATV